MNSPRYTVEIRKSAQKALAAIPSYDRHALAAALLSLEDDPFQSGCRKIAARENTWRIRVGRYRIVYEICNGALIVIVIRIGQRKEVYRSL